jgi:hypothetical protein
MRTRKRREKRKMMLVEGKKQGQNEAGTVPFFSPLPWWERIEERGR